MCVVIVTRFPERGKSNKKVRRRWVASRRRFSGREWCLGVQIPRWQADCGQKTTVHVEAISGCPQKQLVAIHGVPRVFRSKGTLWSAGSRKTSEPVFWASGYRVEMTLAVLMACKTTKTIERHARRAKVKGNAKLHKYQRESWLRAFSGRGNMGSLLWTLFSMPGTWFQAWPTCFEAFRGLWWPEKMIIGCRKMNRGHPFPLYINNGSLMESQRFNHRKCSDSIFGRPENRLMRW